MGSCRENVILVAKKLASKIRSLKYSLELEEHKKGITENPYTFPNICIHHYYNAVEIKIRTGPKMNEDIEEIKRHKLEQYASQAQVVQQEKVYDAKKQAVLHQILTPDARERLNTLRITKPELVTNIESQLIVIAQSGRLQKIDDAKLKLLLLQLQPKKREIQIRRI